MSIQQNTGSFLKTGGSSFAVEAAHMGNTPAVLKDLWPLYPVMPELRTSAVQGQCASPTAFPPAGESVLLPRGSCSA